MWGKTQRRTKCDRNESWQPRLQLKDSFRTPFHTLSPINNKCEVIASLFSMNSPICRSLPNATLKTNLSIYQNSMKFCICLLIILNFLEANPLGKVKNEMREDLLCNIGDDHECVCNRTIGNLDNFFMNCLEFLQVLFGGEFFKFHRIQVNKLDVVKVVLRDISLKARLYTNETYEQYLRRRIAHILSQYCENMPGEKILDLFYFSSRGLSWNIGRN